MEPPLHLLTLNIKTLSQQFSITLPATSTVQQLKAEIIRQRHLAGKNLRVIFRGRLLQDNEVLSRTGIENHGFLHVAITDASAAPSPASAWTRLAPGDVAIDIERRGFDRLREAGFSAEDVDEMRQQFHMARPYLANADAATIHRLEEEWIQTNVEDLSPEAHAEIRQREQREMEERRAEEGTYEDMVYGMLLGFLLSIMMCFFMWDKSLPRRAKYGIITGIGCNISFGLLRMHNG